MDWEPKMPSWDLGTVVGPSGGGGGGGALDLKLGAPTSWRPVPAVAAPVQQPVSSAPAKRARSGQGAQQAVPPCSVQGCTADLSRVREYHRRHKVCEAHSKTPVVSVNGQQQRFCQQCSRFHLLGEFDEAKRSCRKRLDGHNRRRRKPQPDPLNPASMFSNHHAGAARFSSYPQIFSTTSMAEPKWPGSIAIKTEADAFHEQYYSAFHLNGGASLFHGKATERKHFPFLTDHGETAGFGCQQPFTITHSSESSSNSSRHSNGKTMFAHDGGPDHSCALSLLSDNPTPAQIMIPAEAQHLGGGGGIAMQFSGGGRVARLPNDSDVSLTGLSYVSLGNKGAPILPTSTRSQHAATDTAAVTTSSAAAQLQQYHGYYHQVSADQGNSAAGSMHALPFSSW
ncbi:squamosa promoter-binding-like protein 2 [Lolium rigidum]|uniref:squamosa promoter-binding-like protein 2 n=1 Tax=Lolium rigidum TaxID=89674 RepID=UPI001F5D72F7|nr:squamosa promoter-binding-like protein 2 [Lolium rigidum]